LVNSFGGVQIRVGHGSDPSMYWIGLGQDFQGTLWIRLDWIGLDWDRIFRELYGLDWIGLDWV